MDVFRNTNHFTIAKLFNDCMGIFCPDGVQYDKVFLVVMHGYVVKAVAGL